MITKSTGDVFSLKGTDRYRFLRAEPEIEAALKLRGDHPFRRVLFELTNHCNSHCHGCGAATVKNRRDSTTLSEASLRSVVDQASALGFLGYAVSGGEPTLDMDQLESLLIYARGKLDFNRLNTNGWWASNSDSTIRTLAKIKAAFGEGNNRYFIPLISISVGQQQASIPLTNALNVILNFNKVFNDDEAQLGISSSYDLKNGSLIGKLESEHLRSTGKSFPYSSVAVVESPIRPEGNAKNLARDSFESKPISELVPGIKCFAPSAKPYLGHSLLIDCFGNIYACHIFCMSKNYLLGNIRDTSIAQAIYSMRERPALNIILEGGMDSLLDHAAKIIPEIGRHPVSSIHQACDILCSIVNGRFEVDSDSFKVFLGGNAKYPNGDYIGYAGRVQWRDYFVERLAQFEGISYFRPAYPWSSEGIPNEKLNLLTSDLAVFYIVKESLLNGVLSRNELELARDFSKLVYMFDPSGKMSQIHSNRIIRFGSMEAMIDAVENAIRENAKFSS